MDEYSNYDLENLIIKDKEYFRKRRNKRLLIFIPPIILIIVVVIVLVFVLTPKQDNKIICYYKTLKEDENVFLINIKDDIKYNLIIDDISHDKKNNHKFGNVGTHKVVFEFKNKLNSLEGLFEGCKNLVEIDFSKLQIDDIESFANLFKSCYNLEKFK